MHSTRRVAAGALVAFAIATPSVVSAQLVDFESLGYGPACAWGGGAAFSSLGGKTWDGFRPLDLTNMATACNRPTNTGYALLQAAYVGNVLALGSGPAWLSSGTPFVLTSLVAGAGWLNPTKLTLEFYLNGAYQASSVLNLNVTQTGASVFGGLFAGATDFISFTPDYTNGVDTFNSAAESCAGVQGECVPTTYKSWFVDNLTFIAAPAPTVAPEPGTMVLLGAGLLALGGWARRRSGRGRDARRRDA